MDFMNLKKLLISNKVLPYDCKSTKVDDAILIAMDKLMAKRNAIDLDYNRAKESVEQLVKEQTEELVTNVFQVPMPPKYYGPKQRNAGVAALETALQMLGALHRYVNDYYGDSTIVAVKEIQNKFGLVADGYAGKKTVTAINAALVAIGAQYSIIERFGSLIHVYKTNKNQVVDPELGITSKLEKLSKIVPTGEFAGQIPVVRINCGFFWYYAGTGYEHLSTFYDDEKLIVAPSPKFYDMVKYKDGHYNAVELSKVGINSANFKEHVDWAIGSSYTLMLNGKIDIQYAEFFDHDTQRHPRTWVGNKADDLVLFVANGRGKNGSSGLTAEQQASISKEFGLDDAWNFDGGGSSEMAITVTFEVEGKMITVTFIVNEPTDGRERSIGSALFVYNK